MRSHHIKSTWGGLTVTRRTTAMFVALIATVFASEFASAQVSDQELKSISTPNSVETPIGTLEFFDGVPTESTVQAVYDNLDRMRGVEVFLNCMPAASIYRVRFGQELVGADRPNKVPLFEELMDAKSLYLTANSNTLYAWPFLDLKTDGPTVIELPPGMLGVLNDAWFRYVGDFGAAGPDKGKGGKFLILPPGYEGDVPDGYFIMRSQTYRNLVFLRGSTKNGLEAAVTNIKSHLKIYPLKSAGDPPKTQFINVSGKSYNTVSPNDFGFYEDLNKVVQEEPLDAIDSETRGLMASIGIVKGKPFDPDARMKKLLTEAVAIGNATARAITFNPRQKGARLYPDTDSAWVMAYTNKNVFFEVDGARNLDARTMFHYPYTIVTPAMAVTRAGVGSDYGMAYRDAKKQALDGSKTYTLHLPPNVPVKDFWSLTIYDTQTRSMLQTSQKFPYVGSQTKGFQKNADGSSDVYFGPKPPKGKESNWLETVPGKSWFIILRMYGPLEPWINKTWRPGEIEISE